MTGKFIVKYAEVQTRTLPLLFRRFCTMLTMFQKWQAKNGTHRWCLIMSYICKTNRWQDGTKSEYFGVCRTAEIDHEWTAQKLCFPAWTGNKENWLQIWSLKDVQYSPLLKSELINAIENSIRQCIIAVQLLNKSSYQPFKVCVHYSCFKWDTEVWKLL